MARHVSLDILLLLLLRGLTTTNRVYRICGWVDECGVANATAPLVSHTTGDSSVSCMYHACIPPQSRTRAPMPWSRSSTTTHRLLVDANRVIGFDAISVMAVSPSTRRWALVSWCVTTLEAVAEHIFACRGGASDEVLGSAICWWDADLTGEEAVRSHM